jgi:hypothetical protein
MARQSEAVAAINAGFFNRNNQLPLGAIRDNGRWISGPILNRGAIAWNDQGQAVLNRLFLSHTATTDQGRGFPVGQINSGYVQAGIGLYTADWGNLYRPIIDNEILVTVQPKPSGAANSLVERQARPRLPCPAMAICWRCAPIVKRRDRWPLATAVSLTTDVRPLRI